MGDLNKAFACSVPYLRLWGTVAGGWQMARAAQIAAEKIAANDSDAEFYRAKLATAGFYASHVLSQAEWFQAADHGRFGRRHGVDRSAVRSRSQDGRERLAMIPVARIRVTRAVAVITLDNPPVNALSFSYCAKLIETLEAAHADDAVQAVVFTGANGLFSAGADVNDFNREPPPQRGYDSRRYRRDRGERQGARGRDRRKLFGRRFRTIAGVRLPRRDAGREAWPAGDQARPLAGCRWHAAAAAFDRRARRARIYAQRLVDFGRACAGARDPRRSRTRRRGSAPRRSRKDRSVAFASAKRSLPRICRRNPGRSSWRKRTRWSRPKITAVLLRTS